MNLFILVLYIIIYSLIFVFIYIRLMTLIFYKNNIYKIKVNIVNKNMNYFLFIFLIFSLRS